MRNKTTRHTRHTTKLKVSRLYDTKGTNKDSILQSKKDGRAYKQLNIDGQKFFIRLHNVHTRKEKD
tara:strand:+ start:7762 stop:7959 length:198 start_codon:yes stop_codon:yes gene_type:complete